MHETKSPEKHQPILHMLIGLPGSGKTTVRQRIMKRYPDRQFTVISSDDYVEAKAKELLTTYSTTWKDHVKDATSYMMNTLTATIELGGDIIWDQTNITAKSRKGKLDQIPDSYFKIATVVQTSEENIFLRNEQRRQEGRSVPNSIIKQMIKDFQFPNTTYEDFDKIEVYDNENLLI